MLKASYTFQRLLNEEWTFAICLNPVWKAPTCSSSQTTRTQNMLCSWVTVNYSQSLRNLWCLTKKDAPSPSARVIFVENLQSGNMILRIKHGKYYPKTLNLIINLHGISKQSEETVQARNDLTEEIRHVKCLWSSVGGNPRGLWTNLVFCPTRETWLSPGTLRSLKEAFSVWEDRKPGQDKGLEDWIWALLSSWGWCAQCSCRTCRRTHLEKLCKEQPHDMFLLDGIRVRAPDARPLNICFCAKLKASNGARIKNTNATIAAELLRIQDCCVLWVNVWWTADRCKSIPCGLALIGTRCRKRVHAFLPGK